MAAREIPEFKVSSGLSYRNFCFSWYCMTHKYDNDNNPFALLFSASPSWRWRCW